MFRRMVYGFGDVTGYALASTSATLWTWATDGSASHTAGPNRPEDEERAGRMRDPAAAAEFLEARRGARAILAMLLGIALEDVPLETPRGRRPRLSGRPRFALSLSRTRGLAALATAPADVLVGIDVERTGPAAGIIAALSDTERSALESLPPTLRDEAATRCWTVKEAMSKATGTGFAVHPSLARTTILPDGSVSATGDGSWKTFPFDPGNGIEGCMVIRG